MRLTFAVAIAACAVAAGIAVAASGPDRPTTLPPVPAGVRLGLVDNTLDWGTRQAREQHRAYQQGARWLREEIRWREVEPRRGAAHWARFDRLFTNATRQRLRLLPLLVDAPSWAVATRGALPRDPAAFAQFTAAVVDRYGPGGEFWQAHPGLDARVAPTTFEIWNEPDLAQSSGGRPDPERYGRLVEAAATAGRKANPRARFLMAASLGYNSPGGGARSWTADVLDAVPGVGKVVDGLAVHPYTEGSPAAGPRVTRTGFRRIDAIRAEFAAIAGRALPLWITEVGWSTCSARPVCVSEPHQARYLADLFQVIGEEPPGRIAAVFIYRQRDLSESTTDREAAFGLLRSNGSPKPASRVLREIAGGG